MGQGHLEKIDDFRWRIPKLYKPGMRTDGIIYTTEAMLADIVKDKAVEQVANVAFLPGIVGNSLAMPDIHWGYGFPIGGVAATDVKNQGVVSPGGVGFDINCGVRLVKTNLFYEDIKGKQEALITELFRNVPAGLGSEGEIKVSYADEQKLMLRGAAWAVEKGFGTPEDLECTEENGRIKNANPESVSQRAYERGKAQAGTLGSGNHFLEIQMIDTVYDDNAANVLNLSKGQITLMIHTGSRGFGHQICEDSIKMMLNCLGRYKIEVPDRQLACAPVESPEGKTYLEAMACAANYAWANRQILMHLARQTFEKFFALSWEKLGMTLIYDVAHNIAKIEKHVIKNKEKILCVHRKGATRAFGPQHPEIPARYREIGQPVIIPGDMGRNSYLLAGTERAMQETFGSTCHGAGRLKSRTEAIRTLDRTQVLKELKDKGIAVRSAGRETISEEAPQAYKDVNEVVDVVHNAGISKKICRMKPLAVMKG